MFPENWIEYRALHVEGPCSKCTSMLTTVLLNFQSDKTFATYCLLFWAVFGTMLVFLRPDLWTNQAGHKKTSITNQAGHKKTSIIPKTGFLMTWLTIPYKNVSINQIEPCPSILQSQCPRHETKEIFQGSSKHKCLTLWILVNITKTPQKMMPCISASCHKTELEKLTKVLHPLIGNPLWDNQIRIVMEHSFLLPVHPLIACMTFKAELLPI